jgi:hypothetical protein
MAGHVEVAADALQDSCLILAAIYIAGTQREDDQMSLTDAAKAAREKAGRSTDPLDHARANALEAAVKAEQDQAL